MDAKEFTPHGAFATLPRTTRGMPLVINGDPKGKNFLYCNGNSVIIRDIENPAICDIYTEHSTLTTVAKYSPSGFYIASGDQHGKLRIWDTTQKEHILKKEYIPLAGPVKDIAWSPDNQRIAVAGEGREKFGHVFLFDTGTSNGSLAGQSKTMNSLDFRPERPYRIVSASEDNTVAIFEGPPFKFKTHFQLHTRFAQCVRYQPSGAIFASCGADGKVFLFEGSEGTPMGELVDSTCKGNAHGGGVYALSWSPDGRQLLTASGDKTCKIWDVEAKTPTVTFNMGTAVEDQQLSCLWQGNHLLTVSLAGFISYLNPNDPTHPIRVLKGHQKPITSFVSSPDSSYLFTGDSDGNITRWNAQNGDSDRVETKAHKAQVQGMALSGESVISIGLDDTLSCTSNVLQPSLGSVRPQSMKLDSQPRGISVAGELSAVACLKDLLIYRKNQKTGSLCLPFEPSCVAIHPNHHLIAVGGEDSKVHVYQLGVGDVLTMVTEITHVGALTAVSWSPDGTVLAAADSSRRVVPHKTDTWESASGRDWTFHTAKVNCLAWCPDGRHLASGSLDTNIIVWDLVKPGDHPIIIKGAHTMSQITKIGWLSPNCLVSTGQDSNVKQWIIHF